MDILSKNESAVSWWLSEADMGIYEAWNKTLARVREDWICFLGADDYFWDKGVLEHTAPRLRIWQASSSMRGGERGNAVSSRSPDLQTPNSIAQPTRQEGGLQLRGVKKVSEPGKPLITIITSTYNAAEHLPNTISSIRGQTYRNVEWIVVDGASVDDTVNTLRQNEDVIDYWMSEPDLGIYDAWNKGLRHAGGDWILFLGADDYLWCPDVLEKIVPILEKAYPSHRVVYGKVALVNKAGESIYFSGEAWDRVRSRFHSVMCLPHTGLMHHRDLFRMHGEFDISFRVSGDYEFLLRELLHRDAMFVDKLIIAGMSLGGVSSDPVTSGTILFEMCRATRKHGRIFPGMPWLWAAGRYMARRMLWRVLGERGARHVLDWGRRLMGKPAHWSRI